MEAFTGHDRTAIYLSGGASNQSASASLGGLISSRLVRGMSPLYTTPVPGLVVEDATPENGIGAASIYIDGDVAMYTPPGGGPGAGVTIAAGERKVLTGADVTKAVRVYRVPGFVFFGTAVFNLIDAMNGVFSMGDVVDGVRVAGGDCYRAFFVKALASALGVKLWITTDGQADFELASETPVAGAIQTIADETTAPAGRVWVSASSLGTALSVGNMSAGTTVGVWVRRTFPAAGIMALNETVNLHIQHAGS